MNKETPLHYRIVGPLLVFMIIYPFNLQLVKLSLILLCLLFAYSTGIVFRSTIFTKWTLIYLFCNFFPFLLGILYNNPGYHYYIATYFLWPILYYILFRTVDTSFYELFHKCLKIGTWIVLFVGLFAFVYHNIFGTEYILGVKSVYRPGLPFIAIKDGCVNSILLIYSYFIVYSLLNKEKNILLLMLCFVFVFVTSRRVLYAELLLAVLLYFFLARICHIHINRKVVRVFVFLVIILLFVSVFVINYFGFFELKDMLTFFDEISEASDGYRVDQYDALIKGWHNHPLFGSGTGVDAAESRSPTPGTYELTYVAYLFERGVFGLSLYLYLLVFLNIRSIQVLRRYSESRRFLLPLLVSVDMILVANATNPYTSAFDYMWMLFIIFPLLNTKFYAKGLRSNTSVQQSV